MSNSVTETLVLEGLNMFRNHWHYNIQKQNLKRVMESETTVWTLRMISYKRSKVKTHPSVKWLSHVLCIFFGRGTIAIYSNSTYGAFLKKWNCYPLSFLTYQDTNLAKFVVKLMRKWVLHIAPLTLSMFPRLNNISELWKMCVWTVFQVEMIARNSIRI